MEIQPLAFHAVLVLYLCPDTRPDIFQTLIQNATLSRASYFKEVENPDIYCIYRVRSGG